MGWYEAITIGGFILGCVIGGLIWLWIEKLRERKKVYHGTIIFDTSDPDNFFWLEDPDFAAMQKSDEAIFKIKKI